MMVATFRAAFGREDARDLYAKVRKKLSDTRIVVHATSTAGAALPWEFLYDAELDPVGALAQHAHSFIRSRPIIRHCASSLGNTARC